MIIGFAGDGHLATVSAEAARLKGFTVSTKIAECDIVYVAPDRPGDMSPQDAVDLVLPHLREDAVLVIHCQVMPGFTSTVKWPRVYYQVETLKVNDEALDRAMNPERIIIGMNRFIMDARLKEYLASFNCQLLTMSYESAELAKIAINIYLVAQLEATNLLAKVADKIGADWDDIIPALQTDKRIGYHAYLKPGNGIGPHLQRDVDTIKEILCQK